MAIERSFGFFKTTALGGLLFLLPLAVVVTLLAYVYGLVHAIYMPLKEWIPISTGTGLTVLFLAAVGILLLMCFAAGLLARRAIGRQFSRTIERQLAAFFPKYVVYKELLAGNLGGPGHIPSLKPVCIRFDDHRRLGFEADRLPNGTVTIFLPGSPDAWIGSVVLVSTDRVEPLDTAFTELVGFCERLGRDAKQLVSVIE
jgi:uncharacterized membrane protein